MATDAPYDDVGGGYDGGGGGEGGFSGGGGGSYGPSGYCEDCPGNTYSVGGSVLECWSCPGDTTATSDKTSCGEILCGIIIVVLNF